MVMVTKGISKTQDNWRSENSNEREENRQRRKRNFERREGGLIKGSKLKGVTVTFEEEEGRGVPQADARFKS